MKKLLTAGAIAALVLLGGGALPATAATPDVCPAGDSGKIDVEGDQSSVEVFAPEGQLISGYCVKAGPTTQFVELDEPAPSVVITHWSGKDVSHYSVYYVDDSYES